MMAKWLPALSAGGRVGCIRRKGVGEDRTAEDAEDRREIPFWRQLYGRDGLLGMTVAAGFQMVATGLQLCEAQSPEPKAESRQR
jgi:hypothetical protein